MKKYKKSRRYYYFRKQRIMGLILAILGVVSAIVSGGDIAAALLLVPFGLFVMFTKEMLVTDDYFYEIKAKKFEEREL